MQKFKISPTGFKAIKKAFLRKSVPVMLLIGVGSLAISHFSTNHQPDEVNILPLMIPLVLGALAVGLYSGINRQKQLWESYTLTIDQDGITRVQHDTPTITIPMADIREIIKQADGSFMIKANSSVQVIGVPAQIDDYAKLEASLAAMVQITTKSREPILQKMSGLITVLTIGLMAAVFISTHKILVGVSGTVLLVLLGYSFFQVQTSKNVDHKTKKAVWWVILVAASIMGIMYYKLTG